MAAGSVKRDKGVTQLTLGAKELGAGLRVLDSQRPGNSELNRLNEGLAALATGRGEPGRGLGELQTGARRLQDSVAGCREQVGHSVLVSSRITHGLDQLGAGVSELELGFRSATVAPDKLTEGTQQLGPGVRTLTAGVLSGPRRSGRRWIFSAPALRNIKTPDQARSYA